MRRLLNKITKNSRSTEDGIFLKKLLKYWDLLQKKSSIIKKRLHTDR